MFMSNTFKSLAVVVLCAVITTGAQSLPANCSRTYTVQPEDFCDKISAAQNASTYQLATVNSGIIDPLCDNLFVGEVICLGIKGQDCDTVQVVQTGDGCPAIASQAGISLADLLTDNPNVNAACTNIYPGEVLCVAPVADPATAV
ncbi:hypothetical protein CPB84DRAFT_1846802 [Gymnopilus junonius]|uniref:LysM domain-containing protein n=1 Tax=Gymnopilus junonius TaxID=109634 RepID=A0A9P5TMQ7_GYMJU|nr:hypothetical protein CPB84DRAFT_1846802 [Gymnopilus junonius]